MSPPLETVLMMQYKLAFCDAREIVTEGRANLGLDGSTDWDEKLLGECTRLIENTGANMAEDLPSNDKPQTPEATTAQETSEANASPSSNDSVEFKSNFAAATTTSPSTPSKQRNMRTTTPSRVRPSLEHSQSSRSERSYEYDYMGIKQKKSEGGETVVADVDNHSEATAADAGCNVSLSERQEDDGEVVDVEAMTTLNEAIVKQAIKHTKTQQAIKNRKTDEESTVTTFDSSLSDIPTVIYVVRNVDNLNQTKNRSLLQQGKKKNMLGRLRKSFVKQSSKRKSKLLDEDSPEAYENTFVSI